MKLFLFFFILLGTFSVIGQTKTYVGVQGGIHIHSAFLDHTAFGFNARTGVRSGLHSGLQIKHFPRKRDVVLNAGIQIGFTYTQKGWAQVFRNTELPNYRITMNYLEIPIEGVGYFGKKNKYFIAAGVYTEFLTGVRKGATPADIETVDFVTYEAQRDHEIGYGGRVSGGIFRDFSFGSLHFESFFTYSFSNLIDAGDLTNDQLPDTSNLWNAGISVGYFISFGQLDVAK